MQTARHRLVALRRSTVLVLALLGLRCADSAVPDELGRACERIIACAGVSAVARPPEDAECREGLSEAYDRAASYGCAGAYADWVACLGTANAPCEGGGPGGCEAEFDAFLRCQADARQDECVVFGNVGGGGGAGPSGCVIGCAVFSAECAPSESGAGGNSCACTAGAKVDVTFTSAACQGDQLELSARDACQ